MATDNSTSQESPSVTHEPTSERYARSSRARVFAVLCSTRSRDALLARTQTAIAGTCVSRSDRACTRAPAFPAVQTIETAIVAPRGERAWRASNAKSNDGFVEMTL